jgi:hypothetical protein
MNGLRRQPPPAIDARTNRISGNDEHRLPGACIGASCRYPAVGPARRIRAERASRASQALPIVIKIPRRERLPELALPRRLRPEARGAAIAASAK